MFRALNWFPIYLEWVVPSLSTVWQRNQNPLVREQNDKNELDIWGQLYGILQIKMPILPNCGIVNNTQ